MKTFALLACIAFGLMVGYGVGVNQERKASNRWATEDVPWEMDGKQWNVTPAGGASGVPCTPVFRFMNEGFSETWAKSMQEHGPLPAFWFGHDGKIAYVLAFDQAYRIKAQDGSALTVESTVHGYGNRIVPPGAKETTRLWSREEVLPYLSRKAMR